MKKRNVLTMVFVAAFPVLFPGCGLIEELDDSDDVPTDTEGADATCQAIVEATECPPPFIPVMSADIEGDDVTWVDDGGVSIGGIDIGVDGVAYLSGGNASCSVACYADYNASCFHYGGTPCEAGDCSSCILEGSPDTCTCLAGVCSGVDVPDTCYPSGDGGATGDGGDSGGAADETGGTDSGGDSTGAEGVLFDKDTLLWTTPQTLDILDGKVSGTIVTRACDAWEPGDAVGEWLGDPFVSRVDLQHTLERAGAFLADCDGLRLTLADDGIVLSAVRKDTLANLLGFETGDVLLDLNGVPATDLLGLRSELVRIAEGSAAVGTVSYRRDGAVLTQRVRVKG